MDPVTAAIVAALGALGSEAAKEGVKHAVQDAYDGLKQLIRKKWGAESAVAQSLEDVEAKPSSEDLKNSLDNKIMKSGAANDADVAHALAALTSALAKLEAEHPHITESYNVSGNVGVNKIETFNGTLNLDMSSNKPTRR